MAKMMSDLHYVVATVQGTTNKVYLAQHSLDHRWANWNITKAMAQLVNKDFNLDPFKLPQFEHNLMRGGRPSAQLADFILEPYQPVHATLGGSNPDLAMIPRRRSEMDDDSGPIKPPIGEPKRALEEEETKSE